MRRTHRGAQAGLLLLLRLVARVTASSAAAGTTATNVLIPSGTLGDAQSFTWSASKTTNLVGSVSNVADGAESIQLSKPLLPGRASAPDVLILICW